MALITLQQMYDVWKRVSDWVGGTGTDKPKVQNVNSSGTEIFTTTTPGLVKLSDGTDILLVNSDGSLNAQLTGSNVVNGGQVKATLYASGGAEPVISGFYGAADGWSSSEITLATNNRLAVFNGVSWDRVRNNTQGTLLAGAARTTTTNTANQTNYNARGVTIILNVSAASGTGGLTGFINLVGPSSATVGYIKLNATPITAGGLYTFQIFPGTTTTVSPTGSSTFYNYSMALPRTWFFAVQHGDASSYTYYVDYAYTN